MNIFNLSLLSFAFGTFLLGLLVFLRRQDIVGRKWFLFSIAAAIWGFFEALWINDLPDQNTSLMWMRMSHVGAIFIPPTWMDFIYSFLGLRARRRRLLYGAYAYSFILESLTLSDLFLRPPRAFGYFFNYYATSGPLYHFFTFLFFVCVIYAFIETIREYRLATGERREQIKYLIWGIGIGFFGGSLTFLPVYWIDFPQYNLLIMPLYPLVMSYALTKHRLFDVEQIAQAVHKDRLAAIGLLSASINHEIKSPLFVIKGYAETLLDRLENGGLDQLSNEERNERLRKTLQKTIEQTERIVDIAQRLTEFSKPPTDRDVSETVSLNDVLDNVFSFVEHGLKADNIKVEKEIRNGISVRANRKQIEQIFLNLIINASQAMEHQTGLIRIEASERNDTVKVLVRDTGSGIPPDKLNSIFEPFFTTKESGTGLGLYVTKQLVERNKGKISVESQPSQDTTFILEFKGIRQ